MNKLGTVVTAAKELCKNNDSTILTGIAVIGVVATTVNAIRDTKKASNINTKIDDNNTFGKVMIEYVKTYLPTVISGSVTIGCIIGAHKLDLKKQIAAIGTCVATDKICDECINKNKNNDNNVKMIVNDNTKIKCYDSYSGRYFESTQAELAKMVLEINKELMNYHYITLNDVYDYMGLERIGIGDQIGWTIESGSLDIEYQAIIDELDRPVLELIFNREPGSIER